MVRSVITEEQVKDDDFLSPAEHDAEPHEFFDLVDTPNTYSGTTGATLISTGSGLDFTHDGVWLSGEGSPTNNLGSDGNMYLDILNDAVHYRIPSTVLDEYNTNIALTGTASADSVYNGGDSRFVASKANDGDNSGTRWLSDTGAPHWWIVEWTEVKYVSRIGFLAGVAAAAEHFSEYYIEYWANSIWNEAVHVTGYTDERPTVTYHDIGENTDKLRIRTISGNDNHGIYEFLAYGGVETVGGWEEIGTFIANSSLLGLTDTPSAYDDTKYLKSTASGTEWATVSGIQTFLELTDTPSVYDNDKYLKSTASGTEWATVSGGVDTFLDLTDTPTTYSGAEGQYLRATASGTEWATVSGVTIFTDLTDTPPTYDEDKYLKSTASGTEWDSGVQTFIQLTDTPSTYVGTLNQYAMSNGSNLIWATISGIGLLLADNGIPADDLASPGDFYIDKDTEIIYEKVQTISGSVIYSNNLSVSGTNAFAFSEYSGRLAAKAFDGVVGSYALYSWNSTTGDQDYIGYYFPVAKAINKFRMASPASTQQRTPVAFQLRASNSQPTTMEQAEGGTLIYEVKMEGTFDYPTHKTQTTTHWSASEWKEWEFIDNNTEYNYYWFLIWDKDETPFNRGAEFIVSEIEMMDISSPIIYIEYWEQVLATTKNFLELDDTPTTYSGAEGKYLRAIASGTEWATVSGIETFLELTDTPTTYTGTNGAMLVSTGSGTGFTHEGRWYIDNGAPSELVGSYDSFYTDRETNDIYSFVNVLAVSGTESPENETVLLLHMEGSDGENNFYDDGTGPNCPHTISVVNTVTTEIEQRKFGASSAYFVTKNTHKLFTADTSSDWNFGTGAFSIDFFVKFSTGLYNQYLFCIGMNVLSLRLINNILVVYPLTALTYSWTPDTAWHHIALEADGVGNQYLYLDGSVVDSATYGSAIGGTDYMNIGNWGGTGAYSLNNGYIDEFRVVKGVQVGNGTTFPVPEAQYNAGYIPGSSGWEKVGSWVDSSEVNTFLDLIDTPTTYLNNENKHLRVNTTSGIEFVTPLVSSQWTTISGNYTASSGDNLFLASDNADIVISMPSSPYYGNNVAFVDADGNCETNNVTISGSGEKIMGLSDNFLVDSDHARFSLSYYNSSKGWLLSTVGNFEFS